MCEFFTDFDTSIKSVVQKLQVSEQELRSFVYCDFGDPKADQRYYNEVKDIEELRHIVEGFLDEHNSMSKKQMNLVLFRYASIF